MQGRNLVTVERGGVQATVALMECNKGCNGVKG